MRLRVWGLVVLVLALSGLATAQGESNPDQTLPCWKTAQAQSELNACAVQEFEAADKEMNAVYKKVLASLHDSPEQLAAMKKAQRAWLELRDAEVAALHPVGPEHGSVAPMCGSLEAAKLTRERTEQLKRALSSQEGDVCSPDL